jgi:hypothetical protein
VLLSETPIESPGSGRFEGDYESESEETHISLAGISQDQLIARGLLTVVQESINAELECKVIFSLIVSPREQYMCPSFTGSHIHSCARCGDPQD